MASPQLCLTALLNLRTDALAQKRLLSAWDVDCGHGIVLRSHSNCLCHHPSCWSHFHGSLGLHYVKQFDWKRGKARISRSKVSSEVKMSSARHLCRPHDAKGQPASVPRFKNARLLGCVHAWVREIFSPFLWPVASIKREGGVFGKKTRINC